jgi:hypothetical protein
MWVLTRIFSPLVLNLYLDIVDLGLHIVNGGGMSCLFKGDNLGVKGALIRILVSSLPCTRTSEAGSLCPD